MKKTKADPKKAAHRWNKAKLQKTLENWKGKKVLVVGDVGVDRYTMGTVDRISPEAPVPIVHVQSEELKPGLAANVAANIAALGGIATLIGVIGSDSNGQDLKRILKAGGIDSGALITDSNRKTVLKDRVVTERQQLLRVDHETLSPIRKNIENQVLKKIADLLPEVDIVILQDYGKGLVSDILARGLFSLAKKAKKLIAVDPNVKTPLKFYRGSTVFKPNLKEAETLAGMHVDDDVSLKLLGQELLAKTKAAHVVITRGKEGMAIFTAGKTAVKTIPTFTREVYDVSGAGDTVISVLALSMAVGASIEEAAMLGNFAAGIEVSKRGTATVTTDEILGAMDFFEKGMG